MKRYEMSEDTLHDLMVSVFAVGTIAGASGGPCPSRELALEAIKHIFPNYSISTMIEFSELGRPQDRAEEFMQRDIDDMMLNGNTAGAAITQDAFNEMKRRGDFA